MYLRAIVQVQTPGGLYLEGRFNGGFLALMDSQRVTLVVLLDQSVAFDTVSVRALALGALLYVVLRLISLIDLNPFLSTRNFQRTSS